MEEYGDDNYYDSEDLVKDPIKSYATLSLQTRRYILHHLTSSKAVCRVFSTVFFNMQVTSSLKCLLGFVSLEGSGKCSYLV